MAPSTSYWSSMHRTPGAAARIRRSISHLIAVAAATSACDRSAPNAHAEPAPPDRPVTSAPHARHISRGATVFRERTWRFAQTPFGPIDVVVAVPSAQPSERFGVLVALHGRGEALKGPARGARGWLDDYALGRAHERLAAPPLTAGDFRGFVSDQRLTQLNTRLSEVPYRGLIVVCPYIPDFLRKDRAFSEGPVYAEFLVERVLPRVYAETPAIGTAASTGIDGVSLGGRAALFAGLSRPEAFGAIGAIQPAIDPTELERLAVMARSARAKNPHLQLRLLTSDQDYFRDVTHALSRALEDHQVRHDVQEVVGPHDYEFNRGPGSLELLSFHDAALRPQRTVAAPRR